MNNLARDPTTVVGADLSITKSHTGNFIAGADGTYTLMVANAGPAPSAAPIAVIDTLPAGESYVSASGNDWRCGDGTGSSLPVVTCTSASGVASGTSMSRITLVVAVGDGVTGSLTNTAKVVPGPTADPVASNNTTADPTQITAHADLSVTKSPIGSFALDRDGTYALVVANNGPSAAAGPITVTDPLPIGETFVSAEGAGWTCTGATSNSPRSTVTCTRTEPLVRGGSAPTIELVVNVGDGAYPTVTNTAKVSSPTPDPNMSNNTWSDTLTPTPVADLQIKKTLTSALEPGGHASYSVVVTNAGPSAAMLVVVTDPMPSGLVAIGGKGPGWRCGLLVRANEIRCTRPVLKVGASSTVALDALVTAGSGEHLTNTASVTSATKSPPGSSVAYGTSPVAIVRAGHGSPRPGRPSGPLAFTGANAVRMSMVGLLLVLSGIVLLVLARRRQRLN
jgi:uncharacterized repeat protein (TIGR01451 family)